jgi:hypothetical protein
MRRAALVFVGLAAACSTFGSGNANGDPNGVADAAAEAEAASPLAAPVFIGSRTLTFASAPISLLSPAGVRPDDLLVAAWLCGPTTMQRLPSDWIELGRQNVGDPNNGGLTTLVVGYHVLAATESDATTYTFDGTSGVITTIAYRNTGRIQPVTPATVSTIQTQPLGGGVAALDVPPFDTRAISLPLYVFAIMGSTTFPILPGLERVEATSSLAAYCARTASPAATSVNGPHLEITVAGPAPNVMVASLAVVAGP